MEIKFPDDQEHFLPFFRRYCSMSLRTLRKLETDFRISTEDVVIFSQVEILGQVKTLFDSYEIIIVELGEYCELLGITDLGKCILKIFLQMNSIIEWMLKGYLKISERQAKMNFEKSSMEKQTVEKKKNLSVNLNEYYRHKENTRFFAKELQDQIQRVEEKELKDDQSKEKIREMQQKLLNIQPSKTQQIIASVSKLLLKKNQSLQTFLQIKKNNSTNVEDPKNSSIILESNDMQGKISIATKRLQQVFQSYLIQKQKKRLENMSSIHIQVNTENKEQKNQSETMLARYNAELKQLLTQLQTQKQKNKLYQKLIKEKTEEFENQRARFRMRAFNEQKQVKKNKKEEKQKLMKTVSTQTEIIQFKKEKKSQISEKSNSFFNFQNHFTQHKIQQKKPKRKKFSVERSSVEMEINQKQNSLDSYRLQKRQSKKSSHMSKSGQLKKKKTKEQLRKSKIKSKEQIHSNEKIIEIKSISRQSSLYLNRNSHDMPSGVNKLETLEEKNEQNLKNSQILSQTGISYYRTVEFTFFPQKTNQNYCENQTMENGPRLSLKKRKQSSNYRNQTVKKKSLTSNYFENYKSLQNPLKKESSFSLHGSKFHKLKLTEKGQIKKQPQITKIKQPEEAIKFTIFDIENLFLEGKKALDFEFLNYNLNTSKKNSESKKFRRISRRFQPRILDKFDPFAKFNKLSKQDKLIEELMKHLTTMKKSNKKNYENIRNFLRFPHSAIHMSNDSNWKKLQKFQTELTFQELKKSFQRFKKIHAACFNDDEFLCKHLINFLHKIGIQIN